MELKCRICQKSEKGKRITDIKVVSITCSRCVQIMLHKKKEGETCHTTIITTV